MYADALGDVVAIEEGKVVEVQEFTSPEKIYYWNVTYSILIQKSDGIILRYAELDDTLVKEGDEVKPGQLIGHVGLVLNLDKIDERAPKYIQKLKETGSPAMLHFEMHKGLPDTTSARYLGGNYFTNEKPGTLLNPTEYLQSILEGKS